MLSKVKIFLTSLMVVGLLSGCLSANESMEYDKKDETKVKLLINVNLIDGSQILGTRSLTRGEDHSEVLPGEVMHTLRIIVVRQNGDVEHNLFLDFNSGYVSRYDSAEFEVIGGENKDVYLIANEYTKNSSNNKYINYDFAKVLPGQKFNANEVENLMIGVTEASETLNTPLPISNIYKSIYIEPNKDKNVELDIIRATTKLTIEVSNRGSEVEFSNIEIDKFANKSYLFPTDVTYNNNGEITAYTIPTQNNNDHYTFKPAGAQSKVTLATNNTKTFPSYYLLESKYEKNSKPDYKLRMKIFGEEKEASLDNLPNNLPRNTHAVIHVTINNGEVKCTVQVYPYGSIELNPGFGI